MDSGEINKILGGVLGAILVFLLLGFFSELIYFGPGGHEDEDRTLAFAVEVEGAGGAEEEEPAIDFGALLASADASAGASAFNKCQACHKVEDGANAVGPHLHGVVGRDIASVDGFAYSDALMGKEGDWDLENFFHFLHNPSGWAPGTIMGFAGLPDNQDKVNLIVWLNEQSGSPVELVAPEMPETAEEEAAAEGEAMAEGGGAGQAELIAAADPANGESVFKKCQACHRVEEGQNLVGPHLYGVVGRGIANVEGFSYSDALSSKEGEWTFETLSAFLHDPQGWAPGTIMGFAGLEDPQDRADVIVWLNEQGADPVDLATAAPAGGGAAAAGGETASEDQAAAEGEAAEGEDVAEAEAAEEETAAAGEADEEQAASEPGSEAPAEPEAVADEEVETSAEVQADTTSALTEILDEDRVEPLPETEEEASAGGDGIVAMLASADPAAGEQLFRQCQACHRLEDGQNAIGPHLYGVLGRGIASVEGYNYSDALASKEGSWDPATLDAFLADPLNWAPGTKMGYGGLKDPQDRASLIAFLNQHADQPMEFGAAPAATRHAFIDRGVRVAGLGFAGRGEAALEAAEQAEAAAEHEDAAETVAASGGAAAPAPQQAADMPGAVAAD